MAAMKKTLSVNIAGQLFRIEEDAWENLSRYLERVSARVNLEQGGEEIIADIETRIAEIFGNGGEPPPLVTSDMVARMIGIMGEPEDYEAGAPEEGEESAAAPRRRRHWQGAASSRAGRAWSTAISIISRILAVVLRILAVAAGSLFTVFGFLMLFTFAMVLLFPEAALVKSMMEPEIQNWPMLLDILLAGQSIKMLTMITAVVLLIPLAALSYLGIKLIFRIGAMAKWLKIIVFVIWIAAACILTLLLTIHLSVYANHDSHEEKIRLDKVPQTLWIAPLHKIAETGYDEMASADWTRFWRKSSSLEMFGTPELRIYCSDTSYAWISVERRAHAKSLSQSLINARAIDFTWKLSGDTLYLDEYYRLPPGSPWNGSTLDIDVGLPEGTVIKPAAGVDLRTWLYRFYEPGTTVLRIKEGHVVETME